MKRTVMTLLAFALLLAGASAQKVTVAQKGKVKVTLEDGQPLRHLDSLQLDSVYKYWDNVVTEHPKDEAAWRKLSEIEQEMVIYRLILYGKEKEAEQLHNKLNLLGRMSQAIPGTYTYYYASYTSAFGHRSAYADSAIAVMPKDVPVDDYEQWAGHLIVKKDTLRLTKVLTQYYESGQYPASALQYDYNELQGMEKGGVYLGQTQGYILGKLILQLVLGVHKDKILCSEGTVKSHVKRMFESIGIPFSDEIYNSFKSSKQNDELIAIMRYIFEHSKRPVYLSASSRFLTKIPDDLKACLYNEGLTMRYSAKPYNNAAVKRRNVEQRYMMDYLVLQFHPEVKSFHTSKSSSSLAFNYLILLYDLMPYYKKHNAEQYARLNRIFTGIMSKLSDRGWSLPNSDKSYSVNYSNEGGPHYEFQEQIGFKRDPNDDEETYKRKRDEFFKNNTRVLIKTEPIE